MATRLRTDDQGGTEVPTYQPGGFYDDLAQWFNQNKGTSFGSGLDYIRYQWGPQATVDASGNIIPSPGVDIAQGLHPELTYDAPHDSFFGMPGWMAPLSVLGAGLAFGGLGAAGTAGGLGAADTAGLAQMAADAGLTGSAADAFVASGGTLGSTAAGGTGTLSGLIDTPWGVNPQPGTAEQIGAGLGENTAGGVASGINAAVEAGGAGTATDGTLASFLSGIPNSTLLSAGTNLLGAGIGAVGATKAAGIQSDAANQANQTLLSMFNQNRADLAPWRNVGGAAITRAGDILNPGGGQRLLEMDPGYDFRLAEGNKAIDRAAAARGMFDSGPTLKALTRYGQDFAGGEFGNAYNRLLALAGMGQTATANTGQLGATAATNIANNQTSAGAANASGYVGAANAITGGLGGFLRNYQEQAMLDQILGRRSA